MAKPNDFDIPGIYYFESKNIFSGSRGDFNFRIVPEGESFNVTTWHGFICSDLTQPEEQNSFPLTTEGHAQMLAWLDEVFQK